MALAHGRRQPRLPGAIELAVTAIAVAVGVDSAMLLPQQLQRHPWPAQLAVNGRPVRLRPAILGRDRRWRVEPALQRFVGQPSGSGQARPARRARRMQSPAAVALTPRLAAILRLDMPAADSLSTSRILRMGNLAPGIVSLPVERSEAMPIRGSPNGVRHTRPQAGRDPPERVVAINRNGWSRSPGARSERVGKRSAPIA